MKHRMAFVTGAANGIGRGLALALGERGYRVIVCDSSLDEALALVTEIESQGGTAIARCCDVTRSEEIRMVATEWRWRPPNAVTSSLRRFHKAHTERAAPHASTARAA